MGGEIEIELKTGVRLRLSTAVELDYVAALRDAIPKTLVSDPR